MGATQHQHPLPNNNGPESLERVRSVCRALAHYGRNLLAGIVGNTDLALAGLDPSHPAVANLREIERISRQATQLTKDLLTFSGRVKLSRMPVDVQAVMHDVLAEIRPQLPPDARLVTDVPDRVPIIQGAVEAVRQILTNLIWFGLEALERRPGEVRLVVRVISNALQDSVHVDSHESPSQVISCCHEFLTSPTDGVLRVEVRHTGTTHPNDKLPRLTDPFALPGGDGRYLLLGVILGLAEGSNAGMCVFNPAGEGTAIRVDFRLPAAATADDETKSAIKRDATGKPTSERFPRLADQINQSQAPKARPGETILLVANEPIFREWIKATLTLCGYGVKHALDATTAVNELQNSLREGNGIANDNLKLVIVDLARLTPTAPPSLVSITELLPKTPLLVTAGAREAENAPEWLKQPLRALLLRPFDAVELAFHVRQLIDRASVHDHS